MTPPKRRGLGPRERLEAPPLDEKAKAAQKEARRQNRTGAVDGIFARRQEDEPAPAPAPEPSVDEAAAPTTPPKQPSATKTKSKRTAKAAPQTVAPAMPPARPAPEPSVQFGPRIRPDIADRLTAFCADIEATKQDTVDMALAEWLARRGYPATPDVVVPDLPGQVDLDTRSNTPGIPMPPRRGATRRRQLNVRIRPEVSTALGRFLADRPSVVQDVADMAIAEFLSIRGYWLQPAETQAS